ncbi:hypothetical protein SCLCIDRAFT_1223979 [Scleroderma citrinum Foug A]|uniref:Uncharacterized protein n=1 Tax=Scleroderma citrinum Foug A TaxID=1036808 RepID=A0A0C2YR13_9AGAM|nr:hypothetical protein SCLCIDRAFT_1223979 [Scleroderma citrinum Foug A]
MNYKLIWEPPCHDHIRQSYMGRSSQRVWPGNQYFLFFPTLFFEPTCVLEIDNGQRSCTTTFPDEKRGNEQKQVLYSRIHKTSHHTAAI